MKRFREVKVKAAGASAGSAENLSTRWSNRRSCKMSKKLQRAQGDPDAAAKGEKLLLSSS